MTNKTEPQKNKTVQLGFRVKEHERKIIEAAAQKKAMSLSEYIRNAVFGGKEE